MAAIQPSSKRSPAITQRALEEYGDSLEKPEYHLIAQQIANGTDAYKAYLSVFPNASKRSAQTQASILTAHPDFPRLLALHGGDIREKLHALAPAAVERALEILTSEETREARQMVDSILDRTGHPRTKDVAFSVSEELGAIQAEVLEDEAAGEAVQRWRSLPEGEAPVSEGAAQDSTEANE